MSKAYNESGFSDQIVEDRYWRIKEISDLKLAIRRGDSSLRKVLLRALVTICYAHWEGYVRFSARKYFDYIARRKYHYKELDQQFLKNYFLPQLSNISTSKISERCNLIDDILNSSDRRFSRVNDDLINTKSNLNFSVFRDICLVCGIKVNVFEEKATFIDVILLKRRNGIAHGEETLVDFDDLDIVAEETITLMRLFGDALENRILLQEYKASA